MRNVLAQTLRSLSTLTENDVSNCWTSAGNSVRPICPRLDTTSSNRLFCTSRSA